MQGALYFPTIGVPPGPWLMRTLLYWDSLGTIVPFPWKYGGSELDPLTRELLETGLLRAVEPHQGHFRAHFGDWIGGLPEAELEKRRAAFQNGHSRRIHWDKWAVYGGGLGDAEQLGLMVRSKQRRHRWLTVEAETANEFMAGLALGLCHPDSELRRESGFDWFPSTDSADAAGAMFADRPVQSGSDRRLGLRVEGERRTAELRADVLVEALPVPTAPISVQDLLTFRKRHGSELAGLRRELEGRLDEIAFATDDVLAQRLRDRLIDEIADLATSATAHLRASGVRSIARSNLLRMFKFVPGVRELANPVIEAAEIAAGPDRLKAEPLAYLAFAQAELLKPRRHRATHSEMLIEFYGR